MRAIAILCLTLPLAGCAVYENSIFAPPIPVQVVRAQAEAERHAAAQDDPKCQELGFKPGSEAYGNCRLQLQQIRATRAAANATSATRARRAKRQAVATEQDKKVYDASECIGPVIMGRCKGSIIPNKAYHPTCHGEWLNGQCTGPMF